MKVSIGPELAGYINFPLDSLNLDVDAASCRVIFAPHVLNYVPFDKFNDVIHHYVSKLRHGGVITLGGTDLTELNKAYLIRVIDLGYFNKLIYGSSVAGIYTLDIIADKLSELGLIISKKRLDGVEMLVEAKRL